MQNEIGEWTFAIYRDDRGRIVAEVWHSLNGKTLAITECDSIPDAKHWAVKIIRQQQEAYKE